MENDMKRFLTLIAFASLILGIATPLAAATAKPQIARILEIEPDGKSLKLALYAADGSRTVTSDDEDALRDVSTVDASRLGDAVKSLRKGDQGEVTWVSKQSRTLKTFRLVSRETDWTARWKAATGALAILLVLAGLATRGNFRAFVIGADNRYSKSQLQLVIWSGLVLTAYLATVFLRLWAQGLDLLGGVAIPTNLLVLSGFSAITFGAAKAITVTKSDAPGTPRKTLGEPHLRDLVRDDLGNIDFGDFQMIVITLIAAGIYFWQVFHFEGVVAIAKSITLPDIDTVLLSSFGLGQGAYLVKKLALPVGQG
jgi:hypothetical protein